MVTVSAWFRRRVFKKKEKKTHTVLGNKQNITLTATAQCELHSSYCKIRKEAREKGF